MELERRYIYGIIGDSEPKKFDFSGVEGSIVYSIPCQDKQFAVAAVVSDVAVEEIDPTRKNVLAHTTVQEALLKEYTLLPMGFGMIAGSENEVHALLRLNAKSLEDELKRLQNMIEVELKVYWDEEAMTNELEGSNDELTRLKKKIQAAPSPVLQQNLLVKAGQMVERVASEWKTKYAQAIYKTLAKSSVEAQQNNLTGTKNLLNASFLIAWDDEKKFQEEVYGLDETYRGKLNFKYVGPLPPYNFVRVKLEMGL